MPAELRPKKRTPLPYIVSALVFAFILVLAAYLYVDGIAQLSSIRQAQAEAEDERVALQSVYDELRKIRQSWDTLQEKMVVIQEISANRVLWSEQMHHLARLTPDNTWLREIQATSIVDREEVEIINPDTGEPERDPRTGKIKTEVRSVPREALRISGYVLKASPDELGVAQFLQNTSSDPEFAKIFEYNGDLKVEPGTYGDKSVEEFTLTYVVRPNQEKGDA